MGQGEYDEAKSSYSWNKHKGFLHLFQGTHNGQDGLCSPSSDATCIHTHITTTIHEHEQFAELQCGIIRRVGKSSERILYIYLTPMT